MRNKIIFILLLLLSASVNLKAQDVNLLTLNQLESRISKGKDTTYVINFWATWCKPCVAELPEFEKLKSTLKGKPVKVILVSVDLKSKLASQVQPFAKKHQLSGDVYLLNESADSYQEKINKEWSGALPATLFVKGSKRKFHETAYTYQELITAVKAVD